ncbi:MAG: hypothetical protein JWN01_1310 [Patescibacteria group bacterium]|nr:hypothetical protein [Patescibacteria group bacterium]
MNFTHATSTKPAVDHLAQTITEHLEAGDHVLWLLSGGSAINVAVEVGGRLRGADIDLAGLIVTLTDERYGPVGHAGSNWRQLEDAGLGLPGATLLPVLAGVDLEATAEEYTAILKNHLHSADYRLGLFGIGPDGHTAGILPHSPAVAATKLAASFDGGQYQRVTMTAPAIALLDEAVVYAAGEPKWPTLARLAREDAPLTEQPAQVLKAVPQLTIFTDYQGETS